MNRKPVNEADKLRRRLARSFIVRPEKVADCTHVMVLRLQGVEMMYARYPSKKDAARHRELPIEFLVRNQMVIEKLASGAYRLDVDPQQN